MRNFLVNKRPRSADAASRDRLCQTTHTLTHTHPSIILSLSHTHTHTHTHTQRAVLSSRTEPLTSDPETEGRSNIRVRWVTRDINHTHSFIQASGSFTQFYKISRFMRLCVTISFTRCKQRPVWWTLTGSVSNRKSLKLIYCAVICVLLNLNIKRVLLNMILSVSCEDIYRCFPVCVCVCVCESVCVCVCVCHVCQVTVRCVSVCARACVCGVCQVCARVSEWVCVLCVCVCACVCESVSCVCARVCVLCVVWWCEWVSVVCVCGEWSREVCVCVCVCVCVRESRGQVCGVCRESRVSVCVCVRESRVSGVCVCQVTVTCVQVFFTSFTSDIKLKKLNAKY